MVTQVPRDGERPTKSSLMEEEPKRSPHEREALAARRTAELVKINEQMQKEINDRMEIGAGGKNGI